MPAHQPISLKILVDSTGYMVRILWDSEIDNLISWISEMNCNGNVKAGRLNRTPVALQTNGLK